MGSYQVGALTYCGLYGGTRTMKGLYKVYMGKLPSLNFRRVNECQGEPCKSSCECGWVGGGRGDVVSL